MNIGRALLLTGKKGSGKTTICHSISQTSPRFSGLLSLAVLNGKKEKIGFDALCIASGETWVLGRGEGNLDGPRYGRFSFSRDGIDRALACIGTALGNPGAVCIIDEIGPLELDKKGGFAPVLPRLRNAGDLLIVIREELILQLVEYIPLHKRQVVEVTDGNRDDLSANVLDFFRPPNAGAAPNRST